MRSPRVAPEIQSKAVEIETNLREAPLREAQLPRTLEDRFRTLCSPDKPNRQYIADSLTLIQWTLFSSLTTFDVTSWLDSSTRSATVDCANCLYQFCNFNKRLCAWIKGDILDKFECEERSQKLSEWIKCAETCFKRGDMASVSTIVAALSSRTIAALKRTWQRIDKKTAKIWSRVQSVATLNKDGCSAIRDDTSTAFIPADRHFQDILRSYQDKLRFVRENGESLINFARYTTALSAAKALLASQTMPPIFDQNRGSKSLRLVLCNLPPSSDHALQERETYLRNHSVLLSHDEDYEWRHRLHEIKAAQLTVRSDSPKSRLLRYSSSDPKSLEAIYDLNGKVTNLNSVPDTAGSGLRCRAVYEGKPVALKMVSRDLMESPERVQWRRKLLDRRLLRHHFLLPFLGVYSEGDSLFMVSSWADGSDVLSYMRRHPNCNRLRIISQIAEGLQYLHNSEPPVVHGRLKPSNVLMSKQGDVFLSDYAIGLQDDGVKSIPLGFGAPEFTADGKGVHDVHTPAADIWAFGSLVMQIMTEAEPFSQFGTFPSEVWSTVVAGRVPEQPTQEDVLARGLDDNLWEVVKSCWAFIPTERPTITDVLERVRRLL
ncbi:kinase-like protein [Sistotremastrum niveocremeum HHB9708]|nr:kinase-like protein [Sistotremastrum niveocremeum HHB9708]